VCRSARERIGVDGHAYLPRPREPGKSQSVKPGKASEFAGVTLIVVGCVTHAIENRFTLTSTSRSSRSASNRPSSSSAAPFGQIADEFVEAFRAGKHPSVEEFARRYPEHADEIRDVLPALVLMEKAKTVAEGVTTLRRACLLCFMLFIAGAASTASNLGCYIKGFLDSFLVGVSGVCTLGAWWNRAWLAEPCAQGWSLSHRASPGRG
jgi:hypothetical protein